MTDKPNNQNPRPVRVSKAPPPITSIKQNGYTLPASPPVPPPNWSFWRLMRDVELWEAVALSVNFEPKGLPIYWGAYEKLGDDPFRICPRPFLERLLVVNSHGGKTLSFKPVHELKACCLVDLPDFAAWAVKQNIPNVPPELLAMAAPEPQATPSPAPEPQAATVVAVSASGGVAHESIEQRRTRYLAMFEAEEKRGKRGALQRVATREGVDRSNMRKDIKKAQTARDEQKRAGAWASQLVKDGKRKR